MARFLLKCMFWRQCFYHCSCTFSFFLESLKYPHIDQFMYKDFQLGDTDLRFIVTAKAISILLGGELVKDDIVHGAHTPSCSAATFDGNM